MGCGARETHNLPRRKIFDPSKILLEGCGYVGAGKDEYDYFDWCEIRMVRFIDAAGLERGMRWFGEGSWIISQKGLPGVRNGRLS
jgi:hypothetical protein